MGIEETYKDFTSICTKPEKIKSLKINGYKCWYRYSSTSLKDTFAKIDTIYNCDYDYRRGKMYYFEPLRIAKSSLILYSDEILLNNLINLNNAEIEFQIESMAIAKIKGIEGFLPFAYDIGEVTVKAIISHVESVTLSSGKETSKIIFKLKPNEKDNTLYTFYITEQPIKFQRLSIDGNSEIIVNEPNVVYLKHKDNRYYKGVAKCGSSDKFDLKKGIEIARLRSETEYIKYKLNNLTK